MLVADHPIHRVVVEESLGERGVVELRQSLGRQPPQIEYVAVLDVGARGDRVHLAGVDLFEIGRGHKAWHVNAVDRVVDKRLTRMRLVFPWASRSELPYNETGKLLRRVIRAKLAREAVDA